MTTSTTNHQESMIRLHMLAAIWGTCYPEDREFVTIWKPAESGQLDLDDAADHGAYSFQVEGLIVRYAMGTYKSVDPALCPNVNIDQAYTWSILRTDWKPEMATPELWEQLRSDLYKAFYQDGSGFFAHDLKFADLAIDWLKTGVMVEAGRCSRLPDETE